MNLVLSLFHTESYFADTLVKVVGACLLMRDRSWLLFHNWLPSDSDWGVLALILEVVFYLLWFALFLRGRALLNQNLPGGFSVTAIKYRYLLVDNIYVSVKVVTFLVFDTAVYASQSLLIWLIVHIYHRLRACIYILKPFLEFLYFELLLRVFFFKSVQIFQILILSFWDHLYRRRPMPQWSLRLLRRCLIHGSFQTALTSQKPLTLDLALRVGVLWV